MTDVQALNKIKLSLKRPKYLELMYIATIMIQATESAALTNGTFMKRLTTNAKGRPIIAITLTS